MHDGKSTLGNKVAALGEHFGLSQQDLATLLGVSRSTIASYKSRSNANPDQARAREWAKRFGIPFAWFLGELGGPPPVPRDYREAERLARWDDDGRVVAVAPEEQSYEDEEFAASGHMVEVPAWIGVLANLDETHFIEERRPRKIRIPPFFFSRKGPDRFIVGIPKGESMAPRIVSPDRVIVRLASDAQPNSIVVARRPDNVNFVKVLRIDRMGKKELHSINEAFPPIVDLTDWTLKGVVVGIWKPYETSGTNIEFNGGMPLRA